MLKIKYNTLLWCMDTQGVVAQYFMEYAWTQQITNLKLFIPFRLVVLLGNCYIRRVKMI